MSDKIDPNFELKNVLKSLDELSKESQYFVDRLEKIDLDDLKNLDGVPPSASSNLLGRRLKMINSEIKKNVENIKRLEVKLGV